MILKSSRVSGKAQTHQHFVQEAIVKEGLITTSAGCLQKSHLNDHYLLISARLLKIWYQMKDNSPARMSKKRNCVCGVIR